MNIQSLNKHLYLLSLLLLGSHVHAQTAKSCIELKNEAQMEQEYTDAQGKKTTRLVAPDKVVPGDEIVYTITAKNVCGQPAGNVVIDNPVPAHMSYVADSALGVGTDITYSLDGKRFARLETLTVKNADGTTRAPRADEIKSIRWVYGTAINAGQTGFVRFRAKVN